jgi:Flp pilus assembly pilin Flp
MARLPRPHLVKDQSGATLVEFGLIAPALILTLMGLLEIGHQYYVQSQLQGAVQKAARAATIENASAGEAQIDARVTKAIRDIVPSAQISFGRKAYATFSDVAQAEDYSDINENGICDDSEPFEDANGNGAWDEDRGREGFGGARDVVLYQADIRYRKPFGASRMLGIAEYAQFRAVTVVRNQPYDEQTVIVTAGNCT